MFEIANDVQVVDADSHWTPTHDLWTKRAPAGYKDRVLHVEVINGENMWVMDGEVLDPVRGGGVVSKDNEKFPMRDAMPWGNEEVHHGAWDTDIRLGVMDDCGIKHQVMFPNSIGLGGQDLGKTKDPIVRQMCVEIYNDTAADLQASTNMRLMPMPIMPAWDIAACVKEVERMA